jgi:purine-binding chemotaxis protein CheW
MDKDKQMTDKQILHQRAVSLARENVCRDVGEQLGIIVCLLGRELYAFETTKVKEIQLLKDVCALPGVPAFYGGVANIRGQILPLVDLKKFFGLTANVPDRTIYNKVVVVQGNDMTLGFLADEVLRSTMVAMSSIQTTGVALAGIDGKFLCGVTSDGIAILDVDQILLDDRLIVNEGA